MKSKKTSTYCTGKHFQRYKILMKIQEEMFEELNFKAPNLHYMQAAKNFAVDTL